MDTYAHTHLCLPPQTHAYFLGLRRRPKGQPRNHNHTTHPGSISAGPLLCVYGMQAACTHCPPSRNTLRLLLMPKTSSGSRQVSPAAAAVLVVPLWWWWDRPCRPRHATRRLTHMAYNRCRASRGGRRGGGRCIMLFYQEFASGRECTCVS